jgi:5-methylcytosine-specific restriction endonuclease McrA
MAYSCSACGVISTGPRCPAHTTTPRTRGRKLQAMRAQTIATGSTCHICGSPIIQGQAWHMDHIVPLVHGGTDHPANLAPAHATCNMSKGST